MSKFGIVYILSYLFQTLVLCFLRVMLIHIYNKFAEILGLPAPAAGDGERPWSDAWQALWSFNATELLSVQLQPPSLVARVCEQTLGKRSNSISCQQWFGDALHHCANDLIVSAPQSWLQSLAGALFHVPAHIARASASAADALDPACLFGLDDPPETAAAAAAAAPNGGGSMYKYKSNGHLLDRFECQNLLYRVAGDYMDWTSQRELGLFRSQLILFGMLTLLGCLVGMLIGLSMCQRWPCLSWCCCLRGRAKGRRGRAIAGYAMGGAASLADTGGRELDRVKAAAKAQQQKLSTAAAEVLMMTPPVLTKTGRKPSQIPVLTPKFFGTELSVGDSTSVSAESAEVVAERSSTTAYTLKFPDALVRKPKFTDLHQSSCSSC